MKNKLFIAEKLLCQWHNSFMNDCKEQKLDYTEDELWNITNRYLKNEFTKEDYELFNFKDK